MNPKSRRRKPGMHVLCVAVWGLLAIAPSRAADTPRQEPPDIRGRRVEADARSPPWNAIAKVQTNTGSKCTGALIARTVVLTAAHCLYNRRTQAMLQPGSLHVLFGFRQGDYLWHGLVRSYVIGPGFEAGQTHGLPAADWARLELAAGPTGIEPLPLAEALPAAGTPIALPGFSQDRSQILLVERCRVIGTLGDRIRQALAHDCLALHGTSGAPLLAQAAGGWRVLGVNIGTLGATSVAVPAVAPGLATIEYRAQPGLTRGPGASR